MYIWKLPFTCELQYNSVFYRKWVEKVPFLMTFLLTLLREKRRRKIKSFLKIEHVALLRYRHYILSHSAFLVTVRHLFQSCMNFIVLAGLAFRPKTGIVETRPHFSRKNMFLL